VAAIELEQLTKVYSDGTRAVRELDLAVGDGEFVVFVGPSGCGKTTALRMIAGLEDITAGTVRVGGEVVNDLPPKARDMAMIFQNYALYPHMNAYDNMAFGLKMRGIDRGEIKRRVQAAAEILGLADVLGKRPRHLSGGQRQRVAMGRAIVREPAAFLMDEPLSNLDAKMRVQVRAEIARIQRDLKVTTVYVTHDQSEAMTLGDRVCVMRGGLLQQVDRPQVLYDRPANLFVAGFIGSPAMNFLPCRLEEDDGALRVRLSEELALPVPPAHTDGDIFVHFEKADVIHAGDLFFNGRYPFIDYSTGGWLGGMIAATKTLSGITTPKTRIIPGHGPLATPEDLRGYLAFLETMLERFTKLKNEGRTVEEVVAAAPAKEFDEKLGKGFMKPEQFVRIAYTGLLKHG